MLPATGDQRSTIVVVDDFPDARELTSELLRQYGYEVKEAANGAEALALAAQGTDLIVLDVNLPDLDGFEVCRRLKSAPATAAIPVLHLSAAYRATAHRVRALEIGGDAYLTQPVDPDELVATVRALLRIRRAEAELRASQERYRGLVDAALEGIWTMDAAMRTTYVNPRMAAMLGCDAGALLGRPFPEFVDAADRLAVERYLTRRATDRAECPDVRFRRADDTTLWVMVAAITARDAEGRFDGALALVTDVSERKRAEAAERESAQLRAVTALASATAHEINNPLTIVIGQLELLAYERPALAARLDPVRDAAHRIADIVSRMVRITRLWVVKDGTSLPEMLDIHRSSTPAP